jgi:2,3-bisphosphoglycerate-independent phosphoglycerate mutase
LGTKFTELYHAVQQNSGEITIFYRNKERILSEYFNGEMHYAYLPWGQSYRQDIPSFASLHGMRASVVCATEIVKGIAVAMGMDVPDIPRVTADTDTDLSAKLQAALYQSKQNPFVLLHFNGTDEASHRRNPNEKADFIRKYRSGSDRSVVGKDG